MKKTCILFPDREISIVTREAPIVVRDKRGKACGITTHDESARGFLAYVNWDCVQAVVIYTVEEQEEEHGAEKG